jgi:rubrerythrin
MPTAQEWQLDDIPYDRIDREKVKDDEALFFVLAGASLVESGADMYTDVLLNYFEGSDAGRWLQDHWQHEELQHGAALRRYVETVWPELDWPHTFNVFNAEYSGYCSTEQLAQTPILELVARCVVETSTASLYRAIESYTDEPVLQRLARHIGDDEVRHYKNFHRFFVASNSDSTHGRWPVFKTLAQRLAELRNEDADCALRHVFAQTFPDESLTSPHFQRVSRAARSLVMGNVNPEMMVRMFLLPLQLPNSIRNSVQRPCAKVMRFFMTG